MVQSEEESGQVLVIVAIFMVVLIGFAALAVDYGSYLIARRGYQNVADSAALAGSAQLSRPLNSTKLDNAQSAAWEALRRQLGLALPGVPSASTAAGNSVTEGGYELWVTTPPSNAGSKYPGNSALTGNGAVFVRVEKDSPSFLSRIFGNTGRRIDAWATAGNQPTRWAVLALCPRNGACPSNAESVTLAGTNTSLRVLDGDLGSNWGLKIQSNAADRLKLPGDSQAYLVDTTCGPSKFLCYPANNVSDGSGTGKLVRVLPAPVEDPNYAEPSWLLNPTSVPIRTLPTLTGGTVTNPTATTVGCTPASPRLGPGRYDVKVDIPANTCVIFDPTFGLTAGQQPGIYLMTQGFNIGNNSFVVGDGVSLFFDTTMDANASKRFNPSGGIVLNTGNANIPAIAAGSTKYGAWTTKGNTPWSVAAGSPATTTWTTPSTSEVGITFYVRKGTGITGIFNMSGTSPLMFLGVLYAPRDNVGIAGAGSQAAVGQIISWTITYNGNTDITQVFDGPADAKSYLLEPRTGQPD